jgi:hypothetical protein
MSMETDLVTLLKTICPRVHPDVGPEGMARPYVTYQGTGGASLRYIDGTAADKRNTLVQVNVWSATRAEANDLIRQIEDVLCASPLFAVDPQGEAVGMYESDTKLYGSLQRFSIYASR